MSTLSETSKKVTSEFQTVSKRFSVVASDVFSIMRKHQAAVDRDAEWQRVHSYVADVLKDIHVLYAKLARLEGDFAGEELTRLERVSEAVLALGNELSGFSKAFYEGKYDMADNDFAYGSKHNEHDNEHNEEEHANTEQASDEAPEAPEESHKDPSELDIDDAAELLDIGQEEGQEEGSGKQGD